MTDHVDVVAAQGRMRLSDLEYRKRFSWKPIHTAPRNEYVLISNPSLGPLPAIAKMGGDHWVEIRGLAIANGNPTHWMPLPPPPTDSDI